MEFVKYHGIGNDFILIDNRSRTEPALSREQAVAWCDRHFGIGADGTIFLLPPQNGADYTMRLYNSDGSEPEMCGNGIRCLAKFIADLEGKTTGIYKIDTLGGVMEPEILPDGRVKVDMGTPALLAGEIPTTLAAPEEKAIDVPLEAGGRSWRVTCVGTGNPHCITFVEDVASLDLPAIGPQFENHPAFPQRTNTEFIQVADRTAIAMRVWERGAGATLACGTGACASVVAGVLTGRCDRACTVRLPGGDLDIVWSATTDRLYMTGPAERVFSGFHGN